MPYNDAVRAEKGRGKCGLQNVEQQAANFRKVREKNVYSRDWGNDVAQKIIKERERERQRPQFIVSLASCNQTNEKLVAKGRGQGKYRSYPVPCVWFVT
jgi:hypothetical protein